MLHVDENLYFPSIRDWMALKLMIRRGLHGRAKLVPIDVDPFPAGAADDFRRRPGIDLKIHQDDSIGVEKEKDFVQPIDYLCGFVAARCFEIPFFQCAKRRRINEDAGEALRGSDKSFFACRSSRKNPDVGGVIE